MTAIQPGLTPAQPADYPRIVEVWEASVRATHHFVSEADIEFFRPLVRDGLPHVAHLICVRDTSNRVVGFIGVVDKKVEMLFIDPGFRSQRLGRRLMSYAITELGATLVDVNEQNEQAAGFYKHLGFVVIERSELDSTGKPYPILHMQLRVTNNE